MRTEAYQVTPPCTSCGSVACAIQSPGQCRHGASFHVGRLADVDMATVAGCSACSSRACMAQSPGRCRHGGGGPRPAPGVVVERPDGVVQDVTLAGGRPAPVFRPTARGGGKGAKR